jgi:hypothetical protein
MFLLQKVKTTTFECNKGVPDVWKDALPAGSTEELHDTKYMPPELKPSTVDKGEPRNRESLKPSSNGTIGRPYNIVHKLHVDLNEGQDAKARHVCLIERFVCSQLGTLFSREF